MKKIFEEYGGVIHVAMAIVALISVVALLVGGNGGGVIGGAFKSTIDKFEDKVGSAMDAGLTVVGSGAGVATDGVYDDILPIEWDATEVQGNPGVAVSFGALSANYVKVSNLTLSEEELSHTKLSIAMTDNGTATTISLDCISVYSAVEGVVVSCYKTTDGEVADIPLVFSASSPGNYTVDDVSFSIPEVGVYVFDWALELGETADINCVLKVEGPAIAAEPGLYKSGTLIKTWEQLVDSGIVYVNDGVVYTEVGDDGWTNLSSDVLDGDLVLPCDGTVTALGDFSASSESGNFSFSACKKLTSVVIPHGVTTISDQSFMGCIALTKIEIPASVTTVGRLMFFYCNNLQTIVFGGTMEQWHNATNAAIAIDGEQWNAGVPATKVVCRDGEVSL